MFLMTGDVYNKSETLIYNKRYLESLKKHKDHRSIVKIANLKKEMNNMTLEKMSETKHKFLDEYCRLNIIALRALKYVLLEGEVPFDYVIDTISEMGLGLNMTQFQIILEEVALTQNLETEDEVIAAVLERMIVILQGYRS